MSAFQKRFRLNLFFFFYWYRYWYHGSGAYIKKWGKKKNRLMLINTLCPSASKQSLQMINMTRKIYEDEDAIGHIPQTLKLGDDDSSLDELARIIQVHISKNLKHKYKFDPTCKTIFQIRTDILSMLAIPTLIF